MPECFRTELWNALTRFMGRIVNRAGANFQVPSSEMRNGAWNLELGTWNVWSILSPMIGMRLSRVLFNALLLASFLRPLCAMASKTNVSNGWTTNAPAIYRMPGGRPTNQPASKIFDHFFPESLSHLVWTNIIAHTNGRETRIWAVRTYPPGWPANPPIIQWNTNGLMWGMKGLTALSPAWSDDGGGGQAPVTALTKRHGYVRGHSMGPASPGYSE